jgi:hypothetical protein
MDRFFPRYAGARGALCLMTRGPGTFANPRSSYGQMRPKENMWMPRWKRTACERQRDRSYRISPDVRGIEADNGIPLCANIAETPCSPELSPIYEGGEG